MFQARHGHSSGGAQLTVALSGDPWVDRGTQDGAQGDSQDVTHHQKGGTSREVPTRVSDGVSDGGTCPRAVSRALSSASRPANSPCTEHVQFYLPSAYLVHVAPAAGPDLAALKAYHDPYPGCGFFNRVSNPGHFCDGDIGTARSTG